MKHILAVVMVLAAALWLDRRAERRHVKSVVSMTRLYTNGSGQAREVNKV